MIYAVSFLIILSPIVLAFVLTASISRRSKVVVVVVFGLFLLLFPIVAFLLIGRSGF